MKLITILTCILALALSHRAAAADTQVSSADGGIRSAPVRLGITSDLVKDFPIAITATTIEDEMGFTLGPKADGLYCTLGVRIIRLKDGSAKITASFSEETKVTQSDGTYAFRNVGFSDLSTVLTSGEDEILFSAGEKKFTIKLHKPKK